MSELEASVPDDELEEVYVAIHRDPDGVVRATRHEGATVVELSTGEAVEVLVGKGMSAEAAGWIMAGDMGSLTDRVIHVPRGDG